MNQHQIFLHPEITTPARMRSAPIADTSVSSSPRNYSDRRILSYAQHRDRHGIHVFAERQYIFTGIKDDSYEFTRRKV